MMQMEIRPTISVWDGDRWHRVDTGVKLLSRATATSAADLISGYRRVFIGVLP